MALKLKVTKAEYDSLDEGIRGLYEEKDGSYQLAVDGIEDTSGLKSALEKERKARADFEKMAKQYQGLGKSPEEIAELVKKHEESEREKLENKGEWDKLKAQLLESHKKELAARDEAVQKMKATLESYLVDASATEAIAAARGVPQLLLPHVKASVKVVEEEGKYHVRVVDKDGSPRMNSKGEYLSIKDLVAEMRESDVFARAFEGNGTSGSGAPSGGMFRKGGAIILSRDDAKDPVKYRLAKEQAQKAGVDFQIADN